MNLFSRDTYVVDQVLARVSFLHAPSLQSETQLVLPGYSNALQDRRFMSWYHSRNRHQLPSFPHRRRSSRIPVQQSHGVRLHLPVVTIEIVI